MSDNIRTFKCILVGDGGIGKTSLLRRIFANIFKTEYEPTIGVKVYPLLLNTNRGLLKLNIWDTAGQKRYMGLDDGYYIQGQCAIIMFDLSSRASYSHVHERHKDLLRVCDNIPVILCGNKREIRHKNMHEKSIDYHRKKGIQYCEISVRLNINCYQPFLSLAQNLLHDAHLEFLDNNPLVPEEYMPILMPAQDPQQEPDPQ